MAKRRGNQEGHIGQRANGLWQCAITIKGEDGKPRRVFRYAKTRAEAAKKLQALQQEQAAGSPTPRAQITLRKAAEEYLEQKQQSGAWSVRTYKIASDILRVHVLPTLGDKRLTDIDVRAVTRWLGAMGNTRTAQLSHQHLRATLALAVRYEWIGRNVAALVPAPKVVPRKPPDTSRADARRILEVMRDLPNQPVSYNLGDYYYLLACLLLGCGLRIGEALGLSWNDWQPEAHTLTVTKKLTHKDGRNYGGFVLSPPKTAAGVRTIAVPRFVAEALESRRASQEAHREAAGDAWANEWGLVFTTDAGRPLAYRNVSDSVRRILARGGIEGVRFHDLRHGHASLLIDDGVPLSVISAALGHKDVGITGRIYIHKLKGVDTRTAAAMEGLVGEEQG